MERSCDRLTTFVCWLGGLGCVPGELCRNPSNLCMTQQYHTKTFLLVKEASEYLSSSIWHAYDARKMSIFGLIMHWLCRNYSQLYMSQPEHHQQIFPPLKSAPAYLSNSIWHDYACWVHFGPNYASIMQKFILIIHESASAPSKNIPTIKISF